MADDRRRREPPTGPASHEGVRPSGRARERFAADIRSEVELTRAAWQDAMLRGRERLVAGDDHGAMEAIEDQRRLLHLLEHRLERVVVAAVVEREAEGVLDRAGAQPTAEQPPPVPGEVTPPVPASERDAAPRGSGGRLRALVAAGAAAAVTAVAVGLGTLVGPVSTPAPEVAGPVDGADEAWSDAGATPDPDVGTADRTSPASAAPPLRAPWPRGWTDHGPSADEARSATSFDSATPPRDRRGAGAPDAGDGEDPRHPTDIPDAPSSDGPRDDDGARDQDEPASDPDESDADDEDALAELRRLVQPDDDAPEDEDGSQGDDEDLPSADGEATSSPEDDGDDGDEAPAGPRDPGEPRSRLDGGA